MLRQGEQSAPRDTDVVPVETNMGMVERQWWGEVEVEVLRECLTERPPPTKPGIPPLAKHQRRIASHWLRQNLEPIFDTCNSTILQRLRVLAAAAILILRHFLVFIRNRRAQA